MQFLALAFAALAAAGPVEKRQSPSAVCPSLDTPQCCDADVLGVAALTCASRTYTPRFWSRIEGGHC